MSRVVVVGAGLGGLAAALRLAHAGHEVTVCEAAPTVGGKLGRERADGFTWDTGPSLVTMPQVLSELFSDVGERMDDHLDLTPLEPIARYHWTDGSTLDTTADALTLRARVDAAFGAGAAADWDRLTRRAAGMWDAVEDPVLRSPVTGPGTILALGRRTRDLRTIAPTRTLRGLGEEFLADPRLRMLLDRYATYTGSDPRLAPAVLATVLHAELAFGGWYVVGGLHRIALVTAALATRRGATVRTGCRVTAVTHVADRVSGVLVDDGTHLPADVVVADADAGAVYGGLVADAPRGAARRVRLAVARQRALRAPASSSGFVLLLGVTGTTPGVAHHNVWFPTDYDAEFNGLFGPRPAPLAAPTVYASVPPDPSQAPEGCESWFVLANAPRHAIDGGGGAVDWDLPGRSEAYAGHLLTVLADRGVDLRDRVVVRRTRSPADLARATAAPGGAIYGSSSNGPAAAFLRAANAGALPGLYLVGGSAHPGGGLPLVLLSAAGVAELVAAP